MSLYFDLGQVRVIWERKQSSRVGAPYASVGPEGLGQPAGVRYKKTHPLSKT